MKFLRCLTAVLLVGGVACQKDNPTIPDPVLPETASTPAPVEAVAVVIQPAPEGGRGSNPGPTSAVIANDCSATLTNIGAAPHGVNIRYTLPLDESVVYLARDVVVPAKGTAPVSAAQAYFEGHYKWDEEECDFRKEVQCDFTAGQGEHLGGKFTRISIHNAECDECEEEPEIVVGPWSECQEVVTARTDDNGPSCTRTRTVTTIFCDQSRRVVVETEPCECECVETGPHEGEPVFNPTILEGSCPVENSNAPFPPTYEFVRLLSFTDDEDKCHQNGTKTTTWDCREPTEMEVCRPAECPNGECVIPEAGTTLSFHGAADCESECEAFGDYECSDNGADFWICKAGNDRIVEHSFPDGDTCRNGKELSHVRACVCEDDD